MQTYTNADKERKNALSVGKNSIIKQNSTVKKNNVRTTDINKLVYLATNYPETISQNEFNIMQKSIGYSGAVSLINKGKQINTTAKTSNIETSVGKSGPGTTISPSAASSVAASKVNNINDFGLSVSQEHGNDPKLSFSFKGDEFTNTMNPITATVHAAYGDHIVYSNTFTNAKKNRVTVKVPRFCEYRVVLSTARGYINVSKIVKVNPPPEIKTEKYTFTASDIMRIKTGIAIYNIALTLLAKNNYVTILLDAISISCQLGELFCNEQTISNGTPFEPHEGWTFQNVFKYSDGYEEHFIDVWDKNGSYQGNYYVGKIKLFTFKKSENR